MIRGRLEIQPFHHSSGKLHKVTITSRDINVSKANILVFSIDLYVLIDSRHFVLKMKVKQKALIATVTE